MTKIGADELRALVPKQAVADAGEARAAGAKAALPATAARSGLLDLGWVRAHVPMIEVADKLNLTRRGKSAICPFHPDRNPSLSFHRNRFRCHAIGCGRRGNVIDLVVGVLGVEVAGALDWLVAAGYKIPILDPERGRRWRLGRAGMGGFGVEIVVASGLLGLLARPAGLLLCTLASLTDPDSEQIEISYPGLARRSGVRDRNKISQALKLLRRLDLLSWRPASSPGGFRMPSTYCLTIDASACALAVEKLSRGTFDGMYGGTVKRDQNMDGGTEVLTPGKPASDLFTAKKKKSVLRREVDPGPKPPPAKKDAADAVEKATPPARRRRARKVRHPGFSREFEK